MDFIMEEGYQVKPGMQEEYQQWAIANQDALRRALPEGIEYIGTYVAVYGSDYTGEAGAICSASTAMARSTGWQPRRVGPAANWVGWRAKAIASST